MDEMDIQRVCPSCQSAYVVPIVYGELTPEHIKGYREGKVALGGRFTSEEGAPDLHCMTCGHEWLSEELV